ncbi:hypothetical protein F5146DRAFT_1065725 [Armillaria mellea]|nr:hypothetical protein F5146DRAFT_1065725 [Armillaria mellea]
MRHHHLEAYRHVQRVVRSPHSHSLFTKGVILGAIAPHQIQIVDNLMSMINHENSKAKGTGVACLSEYFVNDGAMRKLILQQKDNLLVDLMTSLFGEHNHCHYHDKGTAMNAFEAIAMHSESFVQLKQKWVIEVLVHILCVDRWLNVNECVTLLQKLTSGDSRVEMINKIIGAFVTIGANGANLYRTQCFFHAIYGSSKILEASSVLAPNASVMKTIVKAMTYPHSRKKAAEFLKSIAMRSTDVHWCCQL